MQDTETSSLEFLQKWFDQGMKHQLQEEEGSEPQAFLLARYQSEIPQNRPVVWSEQNTQWINANIDSSASHHDTGGDFFTSDWLVATTTATAPLQTSAWNKGNTNTNTSFKSNRPDLDLDIFPLRVAPARLRQVQNMIAHALRSGQIADPSKLISFLLYAQVKSRQDILEALENHGRRVV